MTDRVIIEGLEGSRVACMEMLKLVSLTDIVFDAGRPSGKADEKAHSSSSAVGSGTGVVGFGVKLVKSNIDMEGCDC